VTPSPQQTSTREPSIDALRGLIMIIMALDHTRDLLSRQAAQFRPEDLARTTTAIFLTRWITHFCAPVFMFTAGVAAFLWLRKGHTSGELSNFLWKRGLWLVLLELTVLRFAMFFSLTAGPVFLTILWALGWCMVALSLLIYVPLRPLAVISIAVIALHNLLDPVRAAQFGSFAWLWNVIHQSGPFSVAGVLVILGYPLIPWIFVMSAGFCFGQVMTLDVQQRRRIMTQLGLAMTLAFLVLRAINKYGDLQPRITGDPTTTILSFLRCTKYPPSLDYLLMTLGPALILLAQFDKIKFSKLNPLLIFGRTPLFYFLGHFFLIHLLAIPLAAVRYGRVAFLAHILPSMGGDPKLYPADYGYSLPAVYLIWFMVVAMMYPLCLWFARFKQSRNYAWLRYL
jgi:uncharacterized membrane protein